MCKKDELMEYVIQDIIDMISTDWSIEYDEAKKNLQMKKRDCIWKVQIMFMIYSKMK